MYVQSGKSKDRDPVLELRQDQGTKGHHEQKHRSYVEGRRCIARVEN